MLWHYRKRAEECASRIINTRSDSVRRNYEALLESRNIASAYAQVTGEEQSLALGILDKYRNQHSVSIEDFAEKVACQHYILSYGNTTEQLKVFCRLNRFALL